MIVIHNPLDIWVPQQVKDASGNIDKSKGYPIKEPNGDINCWAIGPGETLEFTDYVGKYLLEVYGFLQKVMTDEQYREEQEAKKAIEEGKVFTQVKIVKAEGEVVDSPKVESGFTNANMQPDNAKVEEGPTAEEFPFTCPDKECGQKFKKENLLKVHYAAKHLVLPTA